MDEQTLAGLSRRLRELVEPIAAAVYFAAEVQWEYKVLGLPTTASTEGDSPWEVHRAGADYGPQYFCSRSACMGRLDGPAVAAVFGIFEPNYVTASVREGWHITTPADILTARLAGVTAALERLLDGIPEGVQRATELLRRGAERIVIGGHPIASGLLGLPAPKHPLGSLWHAAEIIREHRGDSHINAWAGCGLHPIEVVLLSELERGLPFRSHVVTRKWDAGQIDAAVERLERSGWVDAEQLTHEGAAVRAAVELATDRQERRIIEGIGSDIEELFDLLAPWSARILELRGYPSLPFPTWSPEPAAGGTDGS